MKDSNINVVLVAVKVVAGIASGLRGKFAGFVGMVLPHILDRSKDKKQTVQSAVGEALDAVCMTCDPGRICKDICDALSKPAPQTKNCVCQFLFRYFIKMRAPPLDFLKAVIPILVKLTDDGDPTVRSAALQALGSARRLLGNGASVFLGSITDKAKLEKIDTAFEAAVEEWKKIQTTAPKQTSSSDPQTSEKMGGDGESVTVSVPADIDPWLLKDPIEITKQLSADFFKNLQSTKWQERKEALDTLCGLLSDEPKLVASPELFDLVSSLIKVLEKDINVNVAGTCAKVICGTAAGLRTGFAQFIPKVLTICFDRMKDKKPVLRNELICLADQTALCAPLSKFVDTIETGLASKNPQSRSQTVLFVYRLFANYEKCSADTSGIKALVSSIVKACSDGDGDVRENSYKIIAATIKCLGEDLCKRLFAEVMDDKVKAAKIMDCVSKVDADVVPARVIALKRIPQTSSTSSSAAGFVVNNGQSSSKQSNSKQNVPLSSREPRNNVLPRQPSVATSRPRTAPVRVLPSQSQPTKQNAVKPSTVASVTTLRLKEESTGTTKVRVNTSVNPTRAGCATSVPSSVRPTPTRPASTSSRLSSRPTDFKKTTVAPTPRPPLTVRNPAQRSATPSAATVQTTSAVRPLAPVKVTTVSGAASGIRPPSTSRLRPPTASGFRPPSRSGSRPQSPSRD